jgi:hypothetical protein
MLLAWVVMAVAMSINGIFRVKVLAPRWGEVRAGIASAASGIALIQLIAWKSLQTEPSASTRERLGVASSWLLLTVAFEFTIGHFVDRKPWPVLIANYNLLRGRLWPVVLASLVCAPFLSRSRGPKRSTVLRAAAPTA